MAGDTKTPPAKSGRAGGPGAGRRRATAPEIGAAAALALFQASSADGRLFHRFDAAALAAAAAFDAQDVAPVAPFGACAALSGTGQNNVSLARIGSPDLTATC